MVMNLSKEEMWQRFQESYCEFPTLGLALDLSRVNFQAGYFASMRPGMDRAFAAMAELERGAIANPDENRMVGHYWLRNPALAPKSELRADIEETNARISQFAADVHAGKIAPPKGDKFKHILLVGIGGSALGPQFIADALGQS